MLPVRSWCNLVTNVYTDMAAKASVEICFIHVRTRKHIKKSIITIMSQSKHTSSLHVRVVHFGLHHLKWNHCKFIRLQVYQTNKQTKERTLQTSTKGWDWNNREFRVHILKSRNKTTGLRGNLQPLRGPGGSMSWIVGLPSSAYKPITNMAWVRSRLGKLQKRVHSTRSRKW
jgi:hypothetical protein